LQVIASVEVTMVDLEEDTAVAVSKESAREEVTAADLEEADIVIAVEDSEVTMEADIPAVEA
jgi:hypothetical protein